VQQGKAEQEATREVTLRQPELIANLVNEQLLVQQGKELGLVDDVEAEVNRRMLDVAKTQGIKTIEELRKAMKEGGYDYDSVRQTMRTELMQQAVLSRDVDAKIFYGLTSEELKKYYETHKDKFKKPESVTLSEIFLSLAGKSEADVKAKADQLVAEARKGGDFGALAVTNSERLREGKMVAIETKGKVGTFQITDLRENIATAIKNVKAGDVSDPVRYDEGFQILRVDERIAGSEVPVFNDSQAREAMTAERTEGARKTYMEKLRKDAYIKISETYRTDVAPLLGISATPAASNETPTPTSAASAGKKSDKNGNKP
jgi:foldase protein PrsA